MARILLSALSARRGGGLTYLRHIARTFPACPGGRLSIISPSRIEGLPERDDVEWIAAPRWTALPIPRFLFGIVYFRFFWPRRRDFDAVYYAAGSFDIALPHGASRIVAFRNMLPFDRESARRYRLGWIRFRHWLLRYVQTWAFRRADLVIFISEYARRTIDIQVPDRRGRSIVVPHGASPTRAALDPAIAARLPTRFVLYLSIVDVYKAQVELVEAWAELRRQGDVPEKLVLAGPEYPPYARRVREAIRRNGLEGEVILLGNVHYDQVFDLTERAVLNVFMSSCENCPNILLELMAAGRPMLVSDRQPMPELGGPDLDYVDPYGPPAIAAAIARLLGDPDRRARIAKAARERAGLYTWERVGEMTWSAILRTVSDAHSQERGRRDIPGRRASHVER